MYGAGGDKDSSESKVSAQECLGHRHNNVVVQPTPTMVPPVWHVGAMEVPKLLALHNRPVCQQERAEKMLVGGKGDEVERGKGLLGLR